MAINILGFEIGRKSTPKTIPELQGKEEKVKSFIPPEIEDGASVVDFVGGYGFGVQLINYDVAYRNDGELINRYRQMVEHAEVQTAVDDIVNQAIVLNDKSEPVSINLDKSKMPVSIKKKVKVEFDQITKMLDFNTRGSELFKRWYVDGRLYIQILMDEKKQKEGIAELRVIDPTKIQKIRNIEREVNSNGIKFIKRIQEYYLYTADDFVGTGRDTINYRYASDGVIIAPDSIAYVNSGFIDPSTKKVLGYLHKAIKPLNQLRMLEDATVIYRISRAPERRIFYIDVGSLPKNKSEQYLREIMQRYKNKLVYDTATGELRDEKRHMHMLEDFWMPRREGGKGTEVQTLPAGQNLGELQDVEYFLKKLYVSLHVPPSRFKEDTGFNVGKAAEISRDEVRFAKFVNRLQGRFSELFLQLLRVQLLSKNVLTEDEWDEFSYDIKFDYATDSYFSELKNNELVMTRLGSLREVEPYLGRFFSSNWVKRNILQMTDDDIESMDKEIKNEKESGENQPQEEMMGGMEPQIQGEVSTEGAEQTPPVTTETPVADIGLEEIKPEGTEDETTLGELPDMESTTGEEEQLPNQMSDEEVDDLIASFGEPPIEEEEEEEEEEPKEKNKSSEMSNKEVEDMIANFEEFSNYNGHTREFVFPLNELAKSSSSKKTKLSPFASKILKSVLENKTQNP